MITLASDFPSPYPAAMRGVICSRSDARIEDIAHDFPRQDVRAAAFWLREVLPYFPPATHCAVVDPGVGTDRSALVVEAGDHAIVAPDNGVAIPVARELAGGDAEAESSGDDFDVWEIEYEDSETASTTFHGRDVFAPAAADVHDEGGPAALDRCSRTDDWVDLTFPEPDMVAKGARGEVLVVDGFGNVITNVPGDPIADCEGIRVDDELIPVRDAYAARDPGDRLVTVGSHGNVELAVNRGRGDEAFGLSAGDSVLLEW
ncbi:SAM hydrolase/SAM-dependent halogenase family protein [Halosimplex pelagicum]|uniref:SAM-dependent chlorinase/fluorinase n=1 Tax=Halosimplex pelagicum TaxID=869886 RepID=A0A7D5SWZ5_9EURY|nr:SAM-dependent chlorinase/fluorinase [Halosimplex pelagicum]QLH83447.1 SAM-dependent chlorinase/fluorinase [Halosimplex pelagicum]